MRALVFCEHHEGALTKGALGLLAKAAQQEPLPHPQPSVPSVTARADSA